MNTNLKSKSAPTIEKPTNVMAIISLLTSWTLMGIVFGLTPIKEIRKSEEKGMGTAVFAIVTPCILLLMIYKIPALHALAFKGQYARF
jgi:hypothetical protein